MDSAADSASSPAGDRPPPDGRTPQNERAFTLAGFWRTAEARWVALGAALFGILFSYPILLRLTQPSEQNDWDFEAELHWVAYYSVEHFHQLPLWNPYKCGGMPMLGNPQSRILTPFFLLHLIVGPMVGMHLEVTLHLAIAWAGGYLFARLLGLRPLSALLAATVFPAAGWFPLHLGEGHLVFLGVVYLPWLLAAIAASEKRFPIAAVVIAFLFAFSFGEGSVLMIVTELPVIGIYVLSEMLRRRSFRPLGAIAIGGTLGLGLAAVDLMPAVELVRERGRVPWGPAWVMWHDLPQIWFARDQVQLALQNRFFIEFGSYLSPAFVVLAAASLIFFRRRIIVWIAIGWFLILAIRGDNCLIPVFSWMRDLPFLSIMRLSSRFLIPFAFCVGVLAAYGAEELQRRFGRIGQWCVAALLVAGTIDSLLVGTPFLVHAFDRVPAQIPHSANFRQLDHANVFDQTVIAQANMGIVNCYEYTHWKTTVSGYNDPGYNGEQFLFAGIGSVLPLEWTPNELSYQVDSRWPSEVVINQNYDPGWRLERGQGVVRPLNGWLAVSVPAGRQTIVLKYRDRAFEVGAIVSLLSLLIAAAILLWPRRRDPRPA
jgi:hypothetical protein